MSEHERMRAWADAARGHPTWSVAYAEDVPVLLAELERLTFSDRGHALRRAESDLALCRAEVKRLRQWLELIANSCPSYLLYKHWAADALEGRTV